eukprot:11858330-Ditylum_brightwellii.AAC.2
MVMDGDTIGYIARTHSVVLGPILDFILRNKSGVTSVCIMVKRKWTRAVQGYPIDVLIIIPVPMRLHIVDILDQWNVTWRWQSNSLSSLSSQQVGAQMFGCPNSSICHL